MDQATHHLAPSDGRADSWPGNWIRPRIWRLQAEASMRPSGVVVRGVHPKDTLQLAATEDGTSQENEGPILRSRRLRR